MPQESVAVLLVRIETMERDLTSLKTQLRDYEPVRENALKLKFIQDVVTRLESDFAALKSALTAVDDRRGKEIQALKKEQDDLWLRILWGTVGFIGVVAAGVLVYVLTHLHG